MMNYIQAWDYMKKYVEAEIKFWENWADVSDGRLKAKSQARAETLKLAKCYMECLESTKYHK